jgi:hypothetical protein
MKCSQSPAIFVVFLLLLGPAVLLHSEEILQISEFMAVNDTSYKDEDRDETDWIEVHNAGSGAANLDGWYLTDSSNNLTKWQFPAVALEPDAYLSSSPRARIDGTLRANSTRISN